jgi:hypothetical protein
MRVTRALKQQLAHRDRWTIAEMLQDQPDLQEIDPQRDLDLWRHLFEADDLVLVGQTTTAAASAPAAEYCWGNVWVMGCPLGQSHAA